MGHKIFVSYKYADSDVKKISKDWWVIDTVRTYVDKLEEYLSDISDHVYKGEKDGEDLSALSEETIWKKLKDRIYDSTLTIVMISPNMKEQCADKEQWMPWEISYSLKETSRKNKNGTPVTSSSNALLAIVLPDKQGQYSYYTYRRSCCTSGCRYLMTDILFDIMRKNMFNHKQPNKEKCSDGLITYNGDCSYIISVTWDNFIKAPDEYINKAYEIRENIDNYEITKEV